MIKTLQRPSNKNWKWKNWGDVFNSYPKEVLLSIDPKGKIKISDTVPGRFKPDKNFLASWASPPYKATNLEEFIHPESWVKEAEPNNL